MDERNLSDEKREQIHRLGQKIVDIVIRHLLVTVHQSLAAPEHDANLTVNDQEGACIPNGGDELYQLPLEELYALVYTELLATGVDDPEAYLKECGIFD